jgi:hypothetical protein
MTTPLEDLRQGLALLGSAIEQARQKSDSLGGFTDFIDDIDPAVTFRLEDIAYHLDQAARTISQIRDMLLCHDKERQDG